MLNDVGNKYLTPNLLDTWRPLSARIGGLRIAVELHATFSISHNINPYGVSKDIQRQIAAIVERLMAFRDVFRAYISVDTLKAFEAFENGGAKQNSGNSAGDELLNRAVLIKLFALDAEVNFLISDGNVQSRFNCERAFIHLQRSIVVDPEFRAKWNAAFDHGEEQCERLGSVHLLLFGIWAFKLNAIGARTDLVFSDRELEAIDNPGSVLVLTEWKKTTDNGSASFEMARRQVENYADGILAGNELSGFRYCVVVSKDFIAVPQDVYRGSVVYRHINIAVDPSTPPVAARRQL
jgi:hypothetical protein